ncbi:MAG: ceramidase domain-containing protein [Gammaproteobacteria bacterium]|jgi:hypothetical protein
MNQFLDHYCERLAPGLWGEPLNLLSNVAFLIAGVLIWRVLTTGQFRWPKVPGDIAVLTGLLFAIGIGSGLWHLTAQYWALWTDQIPILLFINIFLLSCLFRVIEVSVLKGILVFAAYHVINTGALLLLPTGFLNGSIFYIPTWLFLAGLTLVIWQRREADRQYYLWALIIFTVALTLRTVDNTLCNIVPTGTHFIWHLLIAATLYLLMLGLINQNREIDHT